MLKRNIIYHCTTAKGRGTITVKSISSLEAPTTIPIDVTAAGTSGKPATRSPYAVLRSANTVAGSCASNLLPNQLVAGGCGTPLCACSALLYPSPDKDPALVSESEEDKSIVYFLFALKVTNSENVLLQHVSRSLFEELIGDHISRHAVAAKLCEDVTTHVQGSPSGKLLAHTFLSAEESGKLKWFNEESKDLTQFYSRAPSLRMLYVMWSIVESTSPAPRPPTRAEIVDVQDRMVAANAPINLCDLASLYIFGFVDKSLIRFIATDMLREFKKTMDALGGAPLSVSSGVQCMLTLLLLWSYAEAVLRVDVLETPPVELLNGASEISRIIHSHIESRQKSRTAVTSKRQDVLYQLLGQITQKLETNVYELAAHCDVPAESDILADLSTWLLIQSPLSESSKKHFKRLVSRRSNEASVALVDSGLLSRQSINLQKVITVLIPLLKYVGDEDFYATTLREVLGGLEDRLRKSPRSFSTKDYAHLAELGALLFANSEGTSHTSFDATARGQMEELQVMDGSPFSLCVASYRSIKEMLEGLVMDHRRLKRQLEKQMRNIGLPMSGAEEEQPTSAATTTDASDGKKEQTGAPSSTAAESHLLVPASIRQRFLVFIEQLVKDSIDENRAVSERPIMISSELFNFVNKSVPVPNIQDEYRRKIFLLVNVAEDPETARRRKAEQLEILLNSSRGRQRGEEKEEKKEVEATGGAEDIPAELRFLVSSLPLTLSPWASVMILREVIAESAGNNPRYTYVLNAAIDLQLPISTTRSRIATTVNMWRFLSTQTQKLSLKESLLLKQRCLLNLPLAYILSSYWSLLAWTSLACLTLLNVFGIDYESQLVANTLFQKFAPFEEIDTFDVAEDANRGGDQPWQKEAAADLASNYLEQDELSHQKNRRSASNIVLSSASYLFLGYDDQRRPMTIVTIQSNPKDHRSGEEEYSAAAAILRELSLHVPFPFFLDIERPLSHNLLVARIAERIRRVSFNNTWFVARLIIRTFPLGREYTERTLVSHTCAQANLTRRRVTFLFYIHPGVPVTPAFLRNIHSSFLCDDANVVLVVHEESLLRGNVTPGNLDSILRQKGTNTAEDRCRVIPFSKELFSLGLIKQSVSWPASRLPKSSTREKVSSRVPKEGSDAGFWTGAIQPVWTPIKGFFQSDEKKDVPKTTDKKVEKEEGQLKKYLVPVPLGVLRETMYAIPSAAGIGSPFQSADPENNKR